MKSNKKTMKKMRIKLNKNTYKKNNRTKHKKQYGGNTTDTIRAIEVAANQINTSAQDAQMITSSTVPQSNQDSSDGVKSVIVDSGDANTTMGNIIEKGLGSDSQDQSEEQPDQSDEKSKQLSSYLNYIQQHPNFVQSVLSNILVKPTAYIINDLGSLLNIEMNNPEKLKTQLDEMADSIQDPVERNKILNYNAQVLAVYLSASKPSIDIISGIFSQEVSEILGDVIYNMSTTVKNMIPGLSLFNDIPQMLVSIVQATTTFAQLTSTGATSTQQNLQQLNKSIMNEVDSKNKLVIEQKKQADILEKQNKLVEFILEKPEIIDSYIKYLNKTKNENLDVNDIIPPSDPNMMTGGRSRRNNRANLDKERETILNAIKESLNDYNM